MSSRRIRVSALLNHWLITDHQESKEVQWALRIWEGLNNLLRECRKPGKDKKKSSIFNKLESYCILKLKAMVAVGILLYYLLQDLNQESCRNKHWHLKINQQELWDLGHLIIPQIGLINIYRAHKLRFINTKDKCFIQVIILLAERHSNSHPAFNSSLIKQSNKVKFLQWEILEVTLRSQKNLTNSKKKRKSAN